MLRSHRLWRRSLFRKYQWNAKGFLTNTCHVQATQPSFIYAAHYFQCSDSLAPRGPPFSPASCILCCCWLWCWRGLRCGQFCGVGQRLCSGLHCRLCWWLISELYWRLCGKLCWWVQWGLRCGLFHGLHCWLCWWLVGELRCSLCCWICWWLRWGIWCGLFCCLRHGLCSGLHCRLCWWLISKM